MKKIIIILSAIIIAQAATAQKIGVKIGLNMATMTSDQSGFNNDKKSLIGVNGGLILEKKLVPFISLQGEVLFSQKGIYQKPDDKNFTKTTINYIEIPVSVKIKLGPTPLFFLGGPYIGYAMNGKTDIEINSVEEKKSINWDNYKMKRIDFGVNAGLGMKFGPIFIEGRYGLGLTDLNNNSAVKNYYKNSVFQFSVGVIL
jgi:hypothetical protein